MKRRLFLLMLIMTMVLVGCSSGKIEEGPETVADELAHEEAEEAEEVAAEDSGDELPIYPDEILMDIIILEPNSIGTVYMEATYTNNSKYPITSYTAKVLLKDTNDTTYLSSFDTVMPGETSPKFETFGPDSQDPNDVEVLTLEAIARTEEGNNLYIDYDFKLGEATWWEGGGY